MSNESLHDRGPAVKAAGALGVIDADLWSWERLEAMEPRLVYIRRRVEAIEDRGDYFCRAEVMGWDVKPVLRHVVGWYRPGPLGPLHESDAWVTALHYLESRLPRCRSCGCMVID